MNEKGFATILGLCLILAIALVVKGIQESEGNHAHETTDFQAEFDLQNAAEIGIYTTAANVKSELAKGNQNILPFNRELNPRKNYQREFNVPPIETSSGSITVKVWGERMLIVPYKVDYAQKTNDNKYKTYWDFEDNRNKQKALGFFSKAELTSPRTGGKLYRRAFGYVLLEEDDTSDWRLHFLNVADKNNYYIETENPYKN